MGLFIGICFILSSLIVVFFTKKTDSITRFNNVVLATILAFNTAFYIATKDFAIINLGFTGLTILFYIASLVKHNAINQFIEVIGLFGILAIAYLAGFNELSLFALAVFVGFIYLAFEKNKSNITFIFISLIPATILSVYIDESLFYIINIMALLGSVRFFLEHKTNESSTYLNNMFVLALSYFIIQSSSEEMMTNLTALSFALSFIIFTSIIPFVSKNKLPMFTRMLDVDEYQVNTYVTTLIYIAYSIAIFCAHHFAGLNIWASIALILIPLAFIHLKLWYKENSGY